MTTRPTLIATSVVRGPEQSGCGGGVYLIDFEKKKVRQVLDWQTCGIDFEGRGWDLGLRGIAVDGDDVYFAASDELFVYGPDFELRASYRNSYLKHAQEIFRYGRSLYVTSPGYNSILVFNLDRKRFDEGLRIAGHTDSFTCEAFDPLRIGGPPLVNLHHLNSVYRDDSGLYFGGSGTGALLKFDGATLVPVAALPTGVHNARPFRGGLLFNDTDNNVVRHITPDNVTTFKVPRFDPDKLTNTAASTGGRSPRQAFGRGLCIINDTRIAAGSSPSTVTFYNLEKCTRGRQVSLTMDVRNAIHGLEVWPF